MTIDWTTYEAVLFDLDGVLTATARLHAASWKRMFDDYLARRASRAGEAFEPFGLPHDYARHVDGLPRYDGVRTFLAARRVALPDGAPDDPPDRETVCGLGNRKQSLFSDLLASEGIDTYPGSVAVVRHLLRNGVRTGVVSSSRSCEAILEAAGLTELFGVRIDGVVAAERGLPGKPAPDTFVHAAHALGAAPSRSVVVEDALSGVEAGRAGGFGLVVAIDRTGNAAALEQAGADVVVTDLGDTLPDAETAAEPGPGDGTLR
jgi:beta-phosphoglucomutase family hydrolase